MNKKKLSIDNHLIVPVAIELSLFRDIQTLSLQSSATVTKTSWSRGWKATALTPFFWPGSLCDNLEIVWWEVRSHRNITSGSDSLSREKNPTFYIWVFHIKHIFLSSSFANLRCNIVRRNMGEEVSGHWRALHGLVFPKDFWRCLSVSQTKNHGDDILFNSPIVFFNSYPPCIAYQISTCSNN